MRPFDRRSTGRVRPLRVLFVNATSELGGTDTDLRETVRALDPAQVRAFVALPAPGPCDDFYRERGVPLFHLPLPMLNKQSLRPKYALRLARDCLLSSLALARIVRRHRIDVVYANSLVLLHASLVARLLGRTAIGRSGELFGRPGSVVDALYWLAGLLMRRIIVSSAAVRARFPTWCQDKVTVVHIGIDLERFRPAPAEQCTAMRLRLGLPAQGPVAIFVGRLVPWKGALFYLDVCAGVARRVPDAHFLLVGSRIKGYDSHRAAIERRAAGEDLRGRVHIYYDQPDVAPLLQVAGVFVHTSLRPEPFGIVLIEAMACGLAVVAAAGGGVPEIDAGAGALTLLEPGNGEAYAAAVQTLLQSQAAQAAAAARALARARQFSVERATQAIQAILRGSVPDGGGPAETLSSADAVAPAMLAEARGEAIW